jgi:hypothetical protein
VWASRARCASRTATPTVRAIFRTGMRPLYGRRC